MKRMLIVLALIAASQFNSNASYTVKPLPVFNTAKFVYKSADFNISIIFPMVFEETLNQEEEDGKIRKKATVKGSDNSGNYFVSVTKHVVKMTDHVNMAEVSMNSFVETIKGEIKSEGAFMYKQHGGKDAVIYLDAQKTYVHYRAILIGDYQYQILVLVDKESRSKSIDDFFKSFKTLK